MSCEEDALAMIARAADGSVRDGLSLLDQAIALGGEKITAAQVKDMLGLADRGLVLDVLEHAMKGECAPRWTSWRICTGRRRPVCRYERSSGHDPSFDAPPGAAATERGRANDGAGRNGARGRSGGQAFHADAGAGVANPS